MTNKLKYLLGLFALLIMFGSCKKTTYSLGDLTAPSNIVITTQVVGLDAAHPNGDGTGNVNITITADNALSYKIDYDANDAVNLVYLPKGTASKAYLAATSGTYTYRITAVAYGKGGTSSTLTKDISVFSAYVPPAAIVTNLTGNSSKTWVVDKSVAGHFGVGPWSSGSKGPDWWAANINEKVDCCNCFYTATYKFTQSGAAFTLQMTTPDGIFSKGAQLSTLPGMPANGSTEQCNNYAGATGGFSFSPATSGIAANAPTTGVAINLASPSTCIGYGSLKSEYEIMVLTSTYMYLRVQGTETGNAWYIKMKAL